MMRDWSIDQPSLSLRVDVMAPRALPLPLPPLDGVPFGMTLMGGFGLKTAAAGEGSGSGGGAGLKSSYLVVGGLKRSSSS